MGTHRHGATRAPDGGPRMHKAAWLKLCSDVGLVPLVVSRLRAVSLFHRRCAPPPPPPGGTTRLSAGYGAAKALTWRNFLRALATLAAEFSELRHASERREALVRFLSARSVAAGVVQSPAVWRYDPAR